MCAASCGDRPPPVRTFTEVSSAAPVVDATAQPPAGPLRWETPSEWREEAASGIRLASFTAGGTNDPARVTLVALPGDGGGIEANVRRWRQQLGQPVGAEGDLEAFLAGQVAFRTADGRAGTLVDFTPLAEGDAEVSMLAAVIPADDRTLFVKMTGPADRLRRERDRLRTFSESIGSAP